MFTNVMKGYPKPVSHRTVALYVPDTVPICNHMVHDFHGSIYASFINDKRSFDSTNFSHVVSSSPGS
jgi:hypothetical protein